MKRITSRAIICLFLSAMLCLGTLVFIHRFINNSSSWVSYPANRHLYTNGQINTGRILDSEGLVMAQFGTGWQYRDDQSMRLSTIHAVGDPGGQIGTGALSFFAGNLTGYNVITGTGSTASNGRDLHLTIDAELSATAYDAMDGHHGLVGIYDYTTGKILCMVSTPAYDPNHPGSTSANGSFINKFLSSRFTPGSIFKIITTTAALEKLDNIENRTFKCTGTVEIGGFKVTCQEPHGTLDLEEALNVSCNCTFGQLAVELGSGIMKGYADSAGLTSHYNVNGIKTAKSSFDFSSGGDADLAWSGCGQGKDLVNACSMMVFCGAIASGGEAASPQIVDHFSFMNGADLTDYDIHYTEELINPETAKILTEYMRTDVEKNYGQKNFPGLNICAKSGTAQVDKTKESNGWFTGFLNDVDHPLAFICMVEEGGSGAKSAGKVINTVLQKAVARGH